jgi:transcriptional antiterminator
MRAATSKIEGKGVQYLSTTIQQQKRKAKSSVTLEQEQQEQPPQQKQEQQQSQPATTEMRAIIELLQLINSKLDAMMANSGTKAP